MGIGKRIKEARENEGLTQSDLAVLVGVTPSSITNYEKETSHPKEPIMYKLLDVLKIDANYLFQDVVSVNYEFKANYKEQKLIETYRSLDDYGRESVDIVLDRESKRTESIAAQAARIAELEAAHKQTTMEQAAAIIGYERATSNLYLYSYMGKIACAGTGFYFDDIPIDTMEAPYMKDADFIIGVNGDSMEPDYHDGDKLYVKKAEELIPGDVGIFTVNDECFLKEFGNEGLISKNPKYNNIPGTEDVVLIGRVIGKVDEK